MLLIEGLKLIDREKLDALFEIGRYDKVIQECIEKLTNPENDQEALYHYILASFANKTEYENLLKFSEEALGKYPYKSDFLYFKSKAYLNLKKLKEAVECIKEALKIDSNDADYHALYAQILLEAKKYPEAKKKIDQALEIDSSDLNYHLTNAVIIYMLDGTRIAREIVDEVLEKDPQNENALYIKQSFFTQKAGERQGILKRLLLQNPFDKDYQSDLKFLKFNYRYVVAFMVISLGFFVSLHYFADIEKEGSLAILLFFVIATIGSYDWRFNIPYIALSTGTLIFYEKFAQSFSVENIITQIIVAVLLHYVSIFFFNFYNAIFTIIKNIIKGKK